VRLSGSIQVKKRWFVRILVLTKRQYTNKDLIDDRFGRLRELPLSLAVKGHSVQGVCLSYSNKNESLIHDGPVVWRSINATSLLFPGLFRFILKARELGRQVDVIWACSDSIYGSIGYVLSHALGIPLIFDLYDNFEYFLMARLPVLKQLYRFVVKRCDAITCVSRPLARLVASYNRKKPTFVLENAVRNDLFMPLNKEACRRILKLPHNARMIGTTGALNRNRGIEILFDAFNLIQEKHDDIHLVLAGPRNIKIPRSPKIHDLGILPLERVPLVMNSLDIGVICNLENEFGKYCFPQKAREFMACDIPIVAAKVGSMQELLSDNKRWLYDPEDSRSLADALANRLEDRRTEYQPLPSWSDIADAFDRIISEIALKNEGISEAF